jgi:uncharacterized protein
MSKPDIEQACVYALGRLAQELSPKLHFHSLTHTRDDVVPAALRLAAQLDIGCEDTQLLRTAACYHDIGFIERRDGHEDVSARIAAATLPHFGYGADQVACVVGMIIATKLPQKPTNLLEQIMADADLDSLGRADFFIRNQALRDELAAFDLVMSDALWYRNQLNFLRSHHYWTAEAASLRGPTKKQHIDELIRRLEAADRSE